MFPRDLVQVWITADDVEHHKPHPEPLLKVAQILGVDPKKCVYIGDTSIDQSAAKAAGMDFIGVTWGAGRDLGDKVISNFYELST
jgi:pyrophosphatase PpaX